MHAFFLSIPNADDLVLAAVLFVRNNYRQALTILREYPPLVQALCRELRITEENFVTFFEAERRYLHSLRREDPVQIQHIEYVKALQSLQSAM